MDSNSLLEILRVESLQRKYNLPKSSKVIALKSQQRLFHFLTALPFIGFVTVVVCAFNFTGASGNFISVMVTVGYALIIGFAAYTGGLFGGFLFGLPRYLSNPDAFQKSYSRNDNLIQISDWLTKIIVGLGLTNLHKVPKLLISFGVHTSVLFGGNGKTVTTGSAFAEGILVYFLFSGFLMGYLWTNIHYIPILVAMDGEANSLTKEMQTKANAFNAALDSQTVSVNSDDPQAYEKLMQQQGAGIQLSFEAFKSLIVKAKQKMDKGLQAQSHIPDDLKDPNKNQWGGKSESNFRKVSGRVVSVGNDLFKVTLSVVSTNPAQPLENGSMILFALHNTFADPYKIVTVKDSYAQLEFISYGAFTVGIFCDNGTTELEYDLTTIANAPEKFINS